MLIKNINRRSTFFTTHARYRFMSVQDGQVRLNVSERGAESTPDNLVELSIDFEKASETGSGEITFTPVPSSKHEGQHAKNKVRLTHDWETPVLPGNLYVKEGEEHTPYYLMRRALQKLYFSEQPLTHDDIHDLMRDIADIADPDLDISILLNTLQHGLEQPGISYRCLVFDAIKHAHYEQKNIIYGQGNNGAPPKGADSPTHPKSMPNC